MNIFKGMMGLFRVGKYKMPELGSGAATKGDIGHQASLRRNQTERRKLLRQTGRKQKKAWKKKWGMK